jgi:peptidoglycan/LPS O-acetylase OafA/YrhL
MSGIVRPGRPAGARLVEIECLRALAVLGVIAFHARGNLFVVRHTLYDSAMRQVDLSTGVDLFFAISGFVIARSLLPALQAVPGWAGFRATAWAFWWRRVWRLLPSAWLWLILILAASACFNRSGVFGTVRANEAAALAGMFDYANIRFAHAFGHYQYGASFAWWSLSLEEQFYLILPPLAFLARRWLPVLLLPAIAYQFQLHRSLLVMAFRTDAILMGVMLAYFERSLYLARLGRWLTGLPRAATLLMTAALFALLITRFHRAAPYDIGLMAVFGSALVFLAAQDRGMIIGPGKTRDLLAWIGARSYGLYLIHIPAFFAARELWFRSGAPRSEAAIAAIAAVLLIGLAEMNWRWVEQPLRRHGTSASDAADSGLATLS